MPLKAQLSHRVVKETNLPYVTNNSPTSTDIIFDAGSADILTSVSGYCQRRPGFADHVEPTPTTFNNLQREFSFERNDGNIYLIACDVNASGEAEVYEMLSGADASFTLIYTDTLSSTPFDFVVSNNTLYFANGNVAKKWDPVNGVSNWGISIGSGTSTSANAGTGTDAGGGSFAWTNPSNITGAANAAYATCQATLVGFGSNFTNYLKATNYGFAISPTLTVSGITVSLVGHITITTGDSGSLILELMQNGVQVGTGKSVGITSSSDITMTFGSTSDLWNTTWSPTQINDSTFGVRIVGFAHSSTGTADVTFSLDSCSVNVSTSSAPVITVSGSAGTMTATVGYSYVYCYGNSNTGHLSSPTAPSASTGAFTNKLNVSIAVVASTDPQVNQIRVFRTTDSISAVAPITVLGGQTYFEIPNSPFPNTTGSVTDNATDQQLNIYSIAPTPTFNDPPPFWQGMVYFSGRIWGYVGNKVWFTGLEEIINGVPEESVPSGTGGNFWAFDQPVNALGTAGIGDSQILAVFCAGRIYAITGNSLDTFRRTRISDRRGCRSRTNVSMLGGMCAWVDTSRQIWVSNGVELKEISLPVRPDFAGMNQLISCLTFHVSENYHWLVVSTGEALLVYDVDTEQWMPPWSFACNYLYSGETSPGEYELMACTDTDALKLNPSAYNDDGTTYSPVIITNLFSMPSEDSPSRSGTPFYIQADTSNANTLSDCSYVVDDDATTATFTSIFTDKSTPEIAYNRNQGVNIVQNVFPLNGPVSRWLSVAFTMRDADAEDKLYSYFIAQEADGPEGRK